MLNVLSNGINIGIEDEIWFKSLLTWSELEGELLDVKVNLNNRLLTYIEEDSEYSVLTPNSVILERDIKLQDDSPEEEEVSENWKK